MRINGVMSPEKNHQILIYNVIPSGKHLIGYIFQHYNYAKPSVGAVEAHLA